MKEEMVPLRLIISYFFPHVKKYKWSSAVAFFSYGIAFLVSSENVVVPRSDVFVLVYQVATMVVICFIAYRLADFAIVYSQSNILRELSNYSFKKIQDHSYKFFTNTFQGSLVAKSKRFVRAFETLQDNINYVFLPTTIQLIGIFLVLVLVAPLVALFFIAWRLVFMTVTVLFVRRRRKYDLETAAADSKVTATLADAITNVLNIKMFSSVKREIDRFANVSDKEEIARRRAWNFNNKTIIVQAGMMVVLEVAGLYISVRFWLDGIISAGTVVLIHTYSVMIFGTMWNLGKAISSSIRALSEASEMIEIYEQKPDVLDPSKPEVCRINKGRIVFDNSTFAYSNDAPVVFKNFNLRINPKEKVGLVGHSGVGKTTVTKLLLRFVDLLNGSIIIDGQDVTKIRQEDLWSKIAYVPQDPVLFHRSLRENIAYGKPDASDEEIMKVSKEAHAHDFISEFSNGYETLVGERVA